MHAHLDALLRPARDTQMFDAIPHRSGALQIFGSHLLNTLLHGRIDAQGNAKGQGCQYHQFMCGIGAIDIKSGVSLCVPQLLCLREHVLEGASFGAHLGQNKVTRAIDNARHLGHRIGGQRFTQHLNDRYTPRHSGLVADLHPGRFCHCNQFIAVLSNQCLIGGHNMLALLNSQLDQIVGDGCAADQLYQHIDVGVSGYVEYIATDTGLSIIMVGVLASRTDMTHHHRLPGSRQQGLGVISQDLNRCQPHRADATNADVERFTAHADSPSAFIGGP